jgi:hypothetical protein
VSDDSDDSTVAVCRVDVDVLSEVRDYDNTDRMQRVCAGDEHGIGWLRACGEVHEDGHGSYWCGYGLHLSVDWNGTGTLFWVVKTSRHVKQGA